MEGLMKKLGVFCCIFFLASSSRIVFNQEVDAMAKLSNMDQAGLQIISISPTAFRTHYVLDGYALDLRAGPDKAYYYVPDGNITAYIPVNLPHGTTVIKFAAIYLDNSDYGYISIALQRRHMITGQIETLSLVGSSAGFYSSSRQVEIHNLINYAQVKNNVYTYHIKIYTYETTDNLAFHGAVVVCQ